MLRVKIKKKNQLKKTQNTKNKTNNNQNDKKPKLIQLRTKGTHFIFRMVDVKFKAKR